MINPDHNVGTPLPLAPYRDAHALGAALVPPRTRVLDVGCGDGTVARMLLANGCEVWGIERDKERAEQATEACKRVVVADVETLDLAAFDGHQFDVLLCLDVLEHLVDPVEALRRLLPLLAPSGRVVMSIPNVTHGAVRLALLDGSFHYTDEGLLDRTHLHLFDRPAVEALLRAADLEALVWFAVERPLDGTEIAVDLDRFPSEVVERVEADSHARTYQFVISAAQAGGDPTRLSPTEQLMSFVDVQRRNFAQAENYARELELALGAATQSGRSAEERLGVLEHELVATKATLGDASAYARHLEHELQTRRIGQLEAEKYAETLSAEMARLYDGLTTTEGRAADLETELRIRMDELAGVQRDIAYFEQALAIREAERAELVSQLDATRTRLTEVDTVFAGLENGYRGLEDRFAVSEAARLAAEDEVANIKRWPAFRLIERFDHAAKRHPGVFRPIRWFGRWLAR